ncbi:hypothetical protein EVAR_61854_1 [Eumeta japonica]|uniref:Uncharacterized protein n=1 Tax=Eumeta variegata TaxID=151549 RepID=A0A4C1ZDI6_EUMVA|nr:hypothetical protein EVAR_61854_1 [Eumeta japonica]
MTICTRAEDRLPGQGRRLYSTTAAARDGRRGSLEKKFTSTGGRSVAETRRAKENEGIAFEQNGAEIEPAVAEPRCGRLVRSTKTVPGVTVPLLYFVQYPIPSQKADNASVTPFGLRMSMGGYEHLLSGGSLIRSPLKNL